VAAIAWSDVVAQAPELATTATLAQTGILAVANVRLNLSIFDGESGPTTYLARVLYAAHLASLIRLGVSGPLIGESAGGLSRTYAAPFLQRSKLALTGYGNALLAIMPPAAFGPAVL
jgi:hypothetical protein